MQCCRQSVNQQENIVCWKIPCCRKVGKENSAMNWFLRVLLTFTNAKEETSDGLSATTEQIPTTRQQEETNIEPRLNHRPPAEQEEPNSQQRLAHFGLGFPHIRRGPFASLSDSLESRSLSSEASRLHVSLAGCDCITLKTKTRWSATPVQERT